MQIGNAGTGEGVLGKGFYDTAYIEDSNMTNLELLASPKIIPDFRCRIFQMPPAMRPIVSR